ncbi:exodeoxyribonuclease VII large subunit [Noviherbaspirillum malthae]|uniref:exodeoxyribonuclease VII large subunit n=1 Tax=Noviherbaspirillum malthae TaxID=1260987 RepID=UPI00188E4DA1|nr:exodeoxyribonuclease VII large subunit [Noviherbaspirillum malthae]
MNTFLSVPDEDSELARSFGAVPDPHTGQLFVPAGMELAPFSAWLPSRRDALAMSILQGRGVSLTDLLGRVAGAIKVAFEDPLWVRIEISQLQMHSGHLYIAAVERDQDGKERAKARAQIWASRVPQIVRKFTGQTSIELAAGIKLLVYARPVFKAEYGFSLDIIDIDPNYTLGDMEARLKRIRERLKSEGLAQRNRQLTAPADFGHVAVISPPDAAGKGDFQTEASRLETADLCRFTYFDAFFQGEKAKESLKDAFMAALAAHRTSAFCALVLIRGGGALTDLHWLNEYVLAGMVCKFPCPVFVGIGHERDTTILDEYAHRSFGTPSKVIAHIRQQIATRALKGLEDWNAIVHATEARLSHAESRVLQKKTEIATSAGRRLIQAEASASRHRETINRQGMVVLDVVAKQADRMHETVLNAASSQVEIAAEKIEHLSMSVKERAQGVAERMEREVEGMFDSITLATRRSIDGIDEHLQDQWLSIAGTADRMIGTAAHQMERDMADTKHFAEKLLGDAQEQSKDLMATILAHGIDPTLKRGFAVVKEPGGTPISSSEAAKRQSVMEIQFRDGTIRVQKEAT